MFPFELPFESLEIIENVQALLEEKRMSICY